jgi:hypothetical protein
VLGRGERSCEPRARTYWRTCERASPVSRMSVKAVPRQSGRTVFPGSPAGIFFCQDFVLLTGRIFFSGQDFEKKNGF